MAANDVLLEYLLPPGSILLLLLAALLLGRWRALGRGLALLATLALFVFSLPAFGDLLLRRLAEGAPVYRPDPQAGLAAVLVPTGGIFVDTTDAWWPNASSVLRGVEGRRWQRELGLPLIIAGGSLEAGRPAEAEVLAAALGLEAGELHLETTSRNSAETAAAVAALLDGRAGPKVLLVTSPTHVARMAAALRHQGVEAVVPPAEPLPDEPELPAVLRHLPSYSGLKRTRAALYEYAGLAWYLASGRIDFDDLRPAPPAP